VTRHKIIWMVTDLLVIFAAAVLVIIGLLGGHETVTLIAGGIFVVESGSLLLNATGKTD
jgi:hypothetical protein